MDKKFITVQEDAGFHWVNYLPVADHPFEDHDDITLLTMCIWGEARGEALPAQLAVGFTVRNRVRNPRWWGRSWREVILKPYQFSAFNQRDPNREKMKDPLAEGRDGRVWRQCLWVAWGVYYHLMEDTTGGATHYVRKGLKPRWAQGEKPCAVIGNHEFYRLEA